MRTRELVAPLRERPFRLQFFARAASVLGDAATPVALAFAVLELTGSATDLGIVLAAHTAPIVAFLLVGGVWADRLPRQRVMLVSDLVRVGTQGSIAVLVLSGSAEIWHLVVLQAVNGTATAFFRPAATGLTPQTVSAPLLQRANALLSLTFSTAGIVGPVVAGVLVATAGAGWAVAFDALTFFVSALFLARLTPVDDLREPDDSHRPDDARKAGATRNTFRRDLAGGWNEVRSRTWLWVSILNYALFQLLIQAPFQVLGPVISERSLGGAAAWATIATAWGIGALVGDVLGMRLQPRRPLWASFVSLYLVVPVMLLLAIRAPAPVTAIAAVAFGVAWSFPAILWFTVLQENVPRDALSRVSSYDWMGSMVLRPIGYAVVGPCAEALGVAPTLIGATLVYAGVTAATLAVPSIGAIERRDAQDTSMPANERAEVATDV